MRVLKFGGTSLADAERIAAAAAIVLDAARAGRVVVVASAMAGVTNRLVDLIEATAAGKRGLDDEVEALEDRHLAVLASLRAPGGASAREAIRSVATDLRVDLRVLADADIGQRAEIADRVLAVGERLSVHLLSAALQVSGLRARPIDAERLVATDDNFGEAGVDHEATRRRCSKWNRGLGAATPVVTGFIGSDPEGRTTTLGRGGSDLTAAVLGAALDADAVEIWTDVDGVLTGPPRLVPSVSSISWLSFEEATELSFFGARVLHAKTVQPLAARGIPILVRNSIEPSKRGTRITSGAGAPSRVVAVSAIEDVTVLRVRGWEPRPNDVVLMSSRASSDGAALVAVPTPRAEAVIGDLTADRRSILYDCFPAAIVALVGHDIGLQPWVAGRALESLARRGIVVKSFAAGAGRHTVALLVDRGDLETALSTIHDALMLDREPAVAQNHRGRKKEVRHVTAA